MSVIRVCEVVKDYNGVKALKGVSFESGEGEVLGILGPNGAGKTTLLHIITGVIPPTMGRVEVMGYDVGKEANKAKSLIGFCPQESVLYDELTGLENLTFYAGLYGLSRAESKKRSMELLEFMELNGAGKKRVKTFSGGMKKRLNLAIALVNDPPVLLLDEPTTGFDPNIRRLIWEKIQELRKQKKTIVLATHNMEEADMISSMVAVMDDGRIIALDTPASLKGLMGPSAVIEVEVTKTVANLEQTFLKYSDEGKVLVKDKILRVYTKRPDSILPLIIDQTIKSGVKILNVHVSEPTLEDVFLKLTGRKLE